MGEVRMRRLKRVGTVVFDCDSTLSTLEGIDVLAEGHAVEVAALTDAAMRGDVPLEAVYGRRLELVRPNRAALERLAAQYVATLVPDARAVIDALRDEGIEVRIISGGLLPAVAALGRALGLRPEQVAAVDLFLDGDGGYAGWDSTSPLARSGGKGDVLDRWRTGVPGPVMLVGDGATDLEARPHVDVFVAYAGVVARPDVVNHAAVVVHSPSLAPVLPLALGGAPPRLARWRPLFEQGLALLDPEYRALLAHTSATGRSDG
jgi:phosphoserine phosphatase